MARYLEVAKEANDVAKALMDTIRGPLGEPEYAYVANLLARLVNLSVRCAPRGVQHTVRLNIVREAVRGLPVKVWMEEKTDERTGRSYHVLVTQPVGGQAHTEAPSEDS